MSGGISQYYLLLLDIFDARDQILLWAVTYVMKYSFLINKYLVNESELKKRDPKLEVLLFYIWKTDHAFVPSGAQVE